MTLKAKLYFSPLGYLIHYGLKFLAMLGRKCIVYGYRDSEGQYLSRCRIASTASISHKKNFKIGDNVWINHYVRIDSTGGVEIGEGCQVGYGSCILSHSSHISIRLMGRHYMEYSLDERPGYVRKPVKIGKYTFIAGGCYILPGVTIGKGCVIGVNSVVTKDVPDYSIVAGSPAKVIGSTLELDKEYLTNDAIHNMYYDDEALNLVVNK